MSDACRIKLVEYFNELEKVLHYDQMRVIQGTSELKRIEKYLCNTREYFNGSILYLHDSELGKTPNPYLQINKALVFIKKAIKEAEKIEFKSIR